MATALVVDDLGVFLVGVELARARAVLQLGDRVGGPHVFLAAGAPGVLAAGVQHVLEHRVVAEGGAVQAQRLFRDLEQPDLWLATDGAGRWGEMNGAHRVELDGCFDLTMSTAATVTPFTATMPIRRLPLLEPMSEIAGRMSVLVGGYFLAKEQLFRTLDDVNLSGKRVLCRVDLNVPIADGKVTDATRIERVVPTLREIAFRMR